MSARKPALGTRACLAATPLREECVGCGGRIGEREIAVCCNVYKRRKWDHVEWFHRRTCYDAAGEPYGPVGERTTTFTAGIVTVHKVRTCFRCGCEFLGPPAGRASCDTCKRKKPLRGAA